MHIFISLHIQQIMAHGIICPLMYDRSNLKIVKFTHEQQNQAMQKASNEFISNVHLKTWSIDLSRMSSSQVSVWGKFSIFCLYCVRESQILAASFVGIRSREVVIVVTSRDLAARNLTKGNSWKIDISMPKNIIKIFVNQHMEAILYTRSEAKTVAMREAITFKHASPLWLSSSSPKSSSKALSLSVIKPCVEQRITTNWKRIT